MATVSALLKRFEITINEANIMESVIANVIKDSRPLRNIISSEDRYDAIVNEIYATCKARGFDEKSIIVAINNILDHKNDYPDLTEKDLMLLSKIKIVD